MKLGWDINVPLNGSSNILILVLDILVSDQTNDISSALAVLWQWWTSFAEGSPQFLCIGS